MIRIDSSLFCAAVKLKDGEVTKAAPILRYMLRFEPELH
jgi:hypothetical protein